MNDVVAMVVDSVVGDRAVGALRVAVVPLSGGSEKIKRIRECIICAGIDVCESEQSIPKPILEGTQCSCACWHEFVCVREF